MNIFLSWIPKINIWGRACAANEETYQLSEIKRAYVHLLICDFKNSFGEPLLAMVDEPSKFPSSECFAMWEALLNLGFQTDDKLKGYQKIGMPPPPEVLAHVKLCDVARQVMMSTVGSGFARSAQPKVTASWKLLIGARHLLSAALSEIRGVDEFIKSTYGASNTFNLDDETWLKLANKTPSFLKSF